MSDKTAELVGELARLARRYPKEAWDSVLEWVQDDGRRSQLISLLSELSQVSRRSPHKRQADKTPSVAGLLRNVEQNDQPKANLLGEFWRKLQAREVLPTLGSLRDFAEIAGLEIATSKKREQAVNHLMRQMVHLPLHDIEEVLQKTSIASRDFGGEYQRWVDLILRRSSSRPGQ